MAFRNWNCKVCVLQIDFSMKSFGLGRSLSICMPSILKCFYFIKWFNWHRLWTGLSTPPFLRDHKQVADKSCVIILLLVTYLYLTGLRLLLETLGWNRVLTWLNSWEFHTPCSGPNLWNMSFSLWLGSLVGDLTIFQEIDPLALAWIKRRSLSKKTACLTSWVPPQEVSSLFHSFSSPFLQRDGPNRFFLHLRMAQKLRSSF